MRKQLAALALLLFAACARLPVQDELTVQFHDDRDEITVTARTTFDLNARTQRQRIETARNAALAGNDAWAVRFGRLSPRAEDVTFSRTRGELERVTRSIVIPADDLQRIFADTSITVGLIRGEGWRELTFYPGTSSRASREQVRHFESQLNDWSQEVARYFTAIDHLYDYLDENPHRAKFVFAALVNEEDAPVLDDELPLVEAVVHAMERIADRMDAAEGESATFAEEADLIYNPFPAKVTVRVPGEKDLVIEQIDLFKALAALEGTFVSPDPLAALLQEKAPTPEQLAEMPRTSRSVLNAGEVAGAIREQLAQPRTVAIRWVE